MATARRVVAATGARPLGGRVLDAHRLGELGAGQERGHLGYGRHDSCDRSVCRWFLVLQSRRGPLPSMPSTKVLDIERGSDYPYAPCLGQATSRL